MSDYSVKDGDVYIYEPERRHCREGVAVAKTIRGEVRLVDTFWGGMGQDAHWLTSDERATAKFEFRPSEYRELDRHESFDDYHPRDRQWITSQHGLQITRFIKLEAMPDLDTKIENARLALEAAEQKLSSARFAVDSRREELERLIGGASQGGADHDPR